MAETTIKAGIAIDPANTNNVYIGTNCGLAISNDAGARRGCALSRLGHQGQ